MFKNRLRQLRKEHNLLQSEVAEKIGVKNSTISNYEQGVREADFETLMKLASFYNVTCDYLIGYSSFRGSPVDGAREQILDDLKVIEQKAVHATKVALEYEPETVDVAQDIDLDEKYHRTG